MDIETYCLGDDLYLLADGVFVLLVRTVWMHAPLVHSLTSSQWD
jgi:hypothetical protein